MNSEENGKVHRQSRWWSHSSRVLRFSLHFMVLNGSVMFTSHHNHHHLTSLIVPTSFCRRLFTSSFSRHFTVISSSFVIQKLIDELKTVFCLLQSLLESLYNPETTPKKKIEDLIHLAELCIDLLQQNEEHHSEVS